MTSDPKDISGRLDTRSEKVRATDRESRKLIDADLQSTRTKTERLKAQRIAQEASKGITDLDRKKPPKRK